MLNLVLGFFGWFSLFLTKIFDKVIAIVSGFFPWLWNFIKGRSVRRFENASFRSYLLGSPLYLVAISVYLLSIISAMMTLIVFLIKIYKTLFTSVESYTTGGGNDSVSLFFEILNSIGILEALKDTFALWITGFLIPVIVLIGSVVYYKSVIITLTSAFEKSKDRDYIL